MTNTNTWPPVCERCGQSYTIEPCCEGPCAHEAERSGMCLGCEQELYVAEMNTPCEHGATVGTCVQCYLDDVKHDDAEQKEAAQ